MSSQKKGGVQEVGGLLEIYGKDKERDALSCVVFRLNFGPV
jgi:hypothetical protein